MKAYELFCLRGCEHGSDLDDWLSAERELSSEADDVLVRQTEAGFEISIAERVEQDLIFFEHCSDQPSDSVDQSRAALKRAKHQFPRLDP